MNKLETKWAKLIKEESRVNVRVQLLGEDKIVIFINDGDWLDLYNFFLFNGKMLEEIDGQLIVKL